MPTLDQIRAPIEAELRAFDEKFRQAALTDKGLLEKITLYILKSKGKQLRPTLVLLSAGCAGSVGERAHTAAMLVELMHTATLVHDDVVDDSQFRRGSLSVAALWKNKVAVLMGDYLLARGLLIAMRHDDLATLRTVAEAVDQMSRGELLQIKKARQLDITEQEYFQIIEKKTASLLAACAKAGAEAGGATPRQAEAMRQYGLNLGIAFQIQDDLFDFQPGNAAGKPAGNDAKERKLTLPLICARDRSRRRERRRLLRLVRRASRGADTLPTLAQIARDKGGFEYAAQAMLRYKEQALAALAEMPPGPCRDSLEALAHFVIDRDR